MDNEQNIPVEAPIETPATPQVTSENRSSGALIGTIIAIVVLVLGGFYLWNTKVQPRLDESKINNDTAMSDNNTSVAIEQLSSQSTSDETASIASDLNATNIDTIDKDLQAI